MNRLHLNFDLSTNEERAAFVRQYLNDPIFRDTPPTESELTTIADYVLWGRNPDSGRNDVQEKRIRIATKHGTWDDAHSAESLDALAESPYFNEATLNDLSTHYTTPTTKFSRKSALAAAPPSLVPILTDLFHRIDVLDYQIELWDEQHERRTKPIRDSLLKKLTPDEIAAAADIISHWSYYYYLKQRHELVELRREQYSIRDSFTNPVLRHTDAITQLDGTTIPDWEVDITVLPLGIMGRNTSLIFRDRDALRPDAFTESDLRRISDYYWRKQNECADRAFDFRNKEHVYWLFLTFYDIEDSAQEQDLTNNSRALLDTLNYYIEFAELDELQSDVLRMKMKHITNVDIVSYINKQYGKNYTDNYISTIFKQRIVPRINAAADEHFRIVGNLPFPEEFKTCICCGRTWLRDADHFVRKARAKDGLNNKCKKCDQADRRDKKVIEFVRIEKK